MASFVINPGGPGGYVIPKRRNPSAVEEGKNKERQGTAAAEEDAKSASVSHAVDKKDAPSSSSSRGTAGPSNAHAVSIRNPLNVWTGSLRFEDQTVESVDLYSPFRESAKPTGFSASLDIKLLITPADCQKYAPFAELFNARFHGTLLRRPHLFVCLPRSLPPTSSVAASSSSSSSSLSTASRTTPMQASYLYLTNTFSPLFARIYDRLKAKEIVAVSALAGNAMLFLLPEGTMTERLGIPLHDKPVFHCIFLRPRPDITEDLCRRGLLTMEQLMPHEQTSADKLDGSDETVLSLVDKYRRTCGLPTVKRSAPSPLNSLLSPGKLPPGGKPPTPYIPTPGATGYAPVALLKQQRNASFGYHSNTHNDWDALLQPPPPPPPPPSAPMQSSLGGGTPRGILSHCVPQRDTLRSPGTEARRPKNQSLFKNALEQIRKINEESKSGTNAPSSSATADTVPSSSIPPLQMPMPKSPVSSTVPRDPRLLKHGNAAAVVEKPSQQQQQLQTTATTTASASTLAPQLPAMAPLAAIVSSRKINEIPVDVRPNTVHSPPCDPRLKRANGAPPLPPMPQQQFLSVPPLPPPSPATNTSANNAKSAAAAAGVVPRADVLPMSAAAGGAVIPSPPPSSPPPPPSSNLSVFKSVPPLPPAMPNLGFKRSYGAAASAMMASNAAAIVAAAEAPPEEKKRVVLPHGIVGLDQQNAQQQFGIGTAASVLPKQSIVGPVPIIHITSDESIIGGDMPMEIDDDDNDDTRPYSPSQATPSASHSNTNDGADSKDEYLDDDDNAEEEISSGKNDTNNSVAPSVAADERTNGQKWTDGEAKDGSKRGQKTLGKNYANVDNNNEGNSDTENGGHQTMAMGQRQRPQRQQKMQIMDDVEQTVQQKIAEPNSGSDATMTTAMELDEKAIQQSPISLVRSLITSPSPKGSPRRERRAKATASASLNASGFGFDFLNWNSTDSPANDAQMTSSSSSNSSSAFRTDETFDVEQLLKQVDHAEITVISKHKTNPNGKEEREDSNLRAALVEGTEEKASSAVVNQSACSTPQSPVNNASSPAVGSPIPTIPSSPATVKKPFIQTQQQQHLQQTSPPSLMGITVPPPSLHLPPPPLLPVTAVPLPPLIVPPPLVVVSNAVTGGAFVDGGTTPSMSDGPQIKSSTSDEHQRSLPPTRRFASLSSTPTAPHHHQQQQRHAPSSASPVASVAVVRPIGSGILHRIHCEPTTIHPSYRMHRLDVPPPVLHMPPPPIVRASSASSTPTGAVADHNDKKVPSMKSPCTAVVLLDPEMIMCCRIKLDELRAVFVAARRNSVRILLHQMITDKLIEVGVKAKPYLALVDEFVAVGAVERMEPHQCDKSGLVLRELLACSTEVAARERRSRGDPKLRILFLSAMIGPNSEDATTLCNSQIEVVNAGQFVDQFK